MLELKCAIVAYIYTNVLTQPGMILHWWAAWAEKLLVKETYDPYERKESWLYKPILGCDKCVAGQIALWSSIYQGYSVPDIIVSICSSILLTILIKGIITKLHA